jgi:hypothetical protein
MFTIKCNVIIGTEQNNDVGIIKLTNSGDDNNKVIIKPKDTNTKLTIASDAAGNISIDDAGLRQADIDGITQSFDSSGKLTTILKRGTNEDL